MAPLIVKVTMEFRDDGRLVYSVHAEGKDQMMLLTYRIDGDVLITDQPSQPKEERTKFALTSAGKLVLGYRDNASSYVRSSKLLHLDSDFNR